MEVARRTAISVQRFNCAADAALTRLKLMKNRKPLENISTKNLIISQKGIYRNI